MSRFKGIPSISWVDISGLFEEDNQYLGCLEAQSDGFVSDRADRKYLALAAKTDSILISNDDDLLSVK